LSGKTFKRELNGSLKELPNCYRLPLDPGEMVVSYSAGGGGYENPKERAIEKVVADYKEGWVIKEYAEKVYGVVIDKNDVVDLIRTKKIRH
jgi:N-methylhydantoinase B